MNNPTSLNSKEEIIKQIIDETKDLINSQEDLSDINTGVEFENHVVIEMDKIAKKHNISVEQTGAQSFPDIIVDGKYGVEVKYTKSNKWESTGNSIFEGTFKKEVTEQIYMFFGMKADKKIEVKVKKYEDCLANIKVTHSPRFYINMDLKPKSSILDALGISYNDFKELSQKEKADKLKQYVRSTLEDGESLWWLDETNDEALSPIVKEFRTLSKSQKRNLIVESIVYFPELFSNKTTKYLSTSMYLLQNYQIISSSLRDTFTAGGKVDLQIKGKTYTLPHIYGYLYEYAHTIKELILEIDDEKKEEYWKPHLENLQETFENIYEDNKELWLKLVDYYAKELHSDILASDVFEEGLKAKEQN